MASTYMVLHECVLDYDLSRSIPSLADPFISRTGAGTVGLEA